jgi:hypothetical protein
MRAGVRPGLQILWVCLRWTGRFDSDSLPPDIASPHGKIFTMSAPACHAATISVGVRAPGKQGLLLGAATILDPESCRSALLAGAQLIVTHSLDARVIEVARL